MANYLHRSKNIISSTSLKLFKRHGNVKVSDVSIGRIDNTSQNPFDLFHKWQFEANQHLVYPLAYSFTLATLSPKSKQISCRVMKYLAEQNNSFLFIGNSETEKMKELKQDPQCSMCFFWPYYHEQKYFLIRQIRMQGNAEEIPKSEADKLYHKTNLPLRVEWMTSKQNQKVLSWDEKQVEYTNNLETLRKMKDFQAPKNVMGFAIVIHEVQFFQVILKVEPHILPDRVIFKRKKGVWSAQHIGA